MKADADSIAKWATKGDSGKLVQALREKDVGVELKENASKALAGLGSQALPPLKKAFARVLNEDYAAESLAYLALALDSLGEGALAAEGIAGYLDRRSIEWADGRAVLALCEILLKGTEKGRLAGAAERLLYQLIVCYRVEKGYDAALRMIRGALRDSPSTEPKLRLARELAAYAEYGELPAINEILAFMGWRNVYPAERDLAYPADVKTRLKGAIDRLTAIGKPDEGMRLGSLVRELLASVLARAVSVSADTWHLFNDGSGYFRGREYLYPKACACCSAAVDDRADFADYVVVDKNDIGKTMTTVSLPFCAGCGPMKKHAVTVEGRELVFHNPAYGYSFATLNTMKSFKCDLNPNHRSEKLRAHLASRGLSDMSRGILTDD